MYLDLADLVHMDYHLFTDRDMDIKYVHEITLHVSECDYSHQNNNRVPFKTFRKVALMMFGTQTYELPLSCTPLWVQCGLLIPHDFIICVDITSFVTMLR